MYEINLVNEKAIVTIKNDLGAKIVTLKSGSKITLNDEAVKSCNKNLLGLMQAKVITVRKIAENKVSNKSKDVNDKKVTKKRPRVNK